MIDGSFIKNRIAVKPIYIAVHNPNLPVAAWCLVTESFAWLVLAMLHCKLFATCFEEEAHRWVVECLVHTVLSQIASSSSVHTLNI